MAPKRLPNIADVRKWFDGEFPDVNERRLCDALELLANYAEEHERDTPGKRISPRSTPSGHANLESDNELQILFLLLSLGWNSRLPNVAGPAMRALVNQLLRRKLPMHDQHLVHMVGVASRTSYWGVSAKGILRVLEAHTNWSQPSPALDKAIRRFRKRVKNWAKYAHVNSLLDRLDAIIDRKPQPLGVERGEHWANQLQDELARMESEQRFTWRRVILHAGDSRGTALSETWLNRALELIDELGESEFRQHTVRWLESIGPSEEAFSNPVETGEVDRREKISDRNAEVLKGLVWMCSLVPDPSAARALFRVAKVCYEKVPRRGERSRVVGNACVVALSRWPHEEGLSLIARLAEHVHTKSAKKFVAKFVN